MFWDKELMKNSFFKIISFLHRIYWKVFRLTTYGSRIILYNKNKVLLIKHWYSNQWFLPGGGISKKEGYKKGLEREISEELKINLPQKTNILGTYFNQFEGKKDHIRIFYSKISYKKFNHISLEVQKIKFFNINKLPKNTSPGTKRRIEEFKTILLRSKTIFSGRW